MKCAKCAKYSAKSLILLAPSVLRQVRQAHAQAIEIIENFCVMCVPIYINIYIPTPLVGVWVYFYIFSSPARIKTERTLRRAQKTPFVQREKTDTFRKPEKSNMKANDAMILWNDGGDEIIVVSHPDTKIHEHRQYAKSWGACNYGWDKDDPHEVLRQLLRLFVSLVVGGAVHPVAAHKAFLDIDEYREAMPEPLMDYRNALDRPFPETVFINDSAVIVDLAREGRTVRQSTRTIVRDETVRPVVDAVLANLSRV